MDPNEPEVTLRGELSKVAGRFRVWISPRQIVGRARDLRALSKLDGTRVWRFHWLFPASLFVLLAVVAGLLVTSDEPEMILGTLPFLIGAGIAVWATTIRPRLIMTPDELIIVKLFRTIRFPTALVTGTWPGYWGTEFYLSDERSYEAGVLQVPNYMRWLGRESKADRVAALIVCEAAILRGEDPATANVPEIKRGLANPFMAIWMAITGSH